MLCMYPDSYYGTINLYSTDNQEQSSHGSRKPVTSCFPMNLGMIVLMPNTISNYRQHKETRPVLCKITKDLIWCIILSLGGTIWIVCI